MPRALLQPCRAPTASGKTALDRTSRGLHPKSGRRPTHCSLQAVQLMHATSPSGSSSVGLDSVPPGAARPCPSKRPGAAAAADEQTVPTQAPQARRRRGADEHRRVADDHQMDLDIPGAGAEPADPRPQDTPAVAEVDFLDEGRQQPPAMLIDAMTADASGGGVGLDNVPPVASRRSQAKRAAAEVLNDDDAERHSRRRTRPELDIADMQEQEVLEVHDPISQRGTIRGREVSMEMAAGSSKSARTSMSPARVAGEALATHAADTRTARAGKRPLSEESSATHSPPTKMAREWYRASFLDVAPMQG